MLYRIERWIDQTNINHTKQRLCCERFTDDFQGFFPPEFLSQAHFVITDKIPRPRFFELYFMGVESFINTEATAITYKNTYYLLPDVVNDLHVHFHELVYIALWQHLGAMPFVQRYMAEVKTDGYHNAPLEVMVRSLSARFIEQGEKVDIPQFIANHIPLN